jgi:hypothetical protein
MPIPTRARTSALGGYVTLAMESHVCTIPVSDKGQVYFLRKNSTLNKKVIGGYEADFTCDFQVFKNRVAKRSLRQIENLVYLSFLEGQYVLNLTDIQMGNPYLQKILKEAAVPPEGEMPDPVNPKQHVQWPIRIENVVGQADKKTYLEWAAMPVMSFVSKSTALASTGLTCGACWAACLSRGVGVRAGVRGNKSRDLQKRVSWRPNRARTHPY